MRAPWIGWAAVAVAVAGCGTVTGEPEVVADSAQGLCQGASVPQGFDAAEFAGAIDWTQAVNSGKKFALLRSSYAGSVGPYGVDATFASTWAGARGRMLRGPWHWFRGAFANQASQADFFVNQFQSDYGASDLPPTVDIEATYGDNAPYTGITGNDAQDLSRLHEFLNELQAKTGRVPMIYTNWDTWNQLGSPSDFSQYPVWVANWSSCLAALPANLPNVKFWQYAGETTTAGAQGNVDLDVFNGSQSELDAFAGTPPASCGSACTACVLDARRDILPFYQANGWSTGCGNRDNIVTNWCSASVDPVGCQNVKGSQCAGVCGGGSSCGSTCTQCILNARTDILPFYQSNGWSTTCGNRDNIVANWCGPTVDPAGCDGVKSTQCAAACGVSNSCGTNCTQCILNARKDILPFYQQNGWDTSCAYRNNIVADWCGPRVDQAGCNAVRTGTCASSCGGGCGTMCTQCILDTRTDILPFYQSNGWSTACGNHDNIVANWCGPTVDPAGCQNVRATSCSLYCAATVRDTLPPSIACPGSQVLEATGPSGAAASFGSVTATDNVSAVTTTLSASSGTTFGLGSTTVTGTAKDVAGNQSFCTFTVKAQDTKAPAVSCPSDITVDLTQGTDVAVQYSASGVDTVSQQVSLQYSQPSGSRFSAGTSAVTVTATDSSGNASTCTFNVTVKGSSTGGGGGAGGCAAAGHAPAPFGGLGLLAMAALLRLSFRRSPRRC